MWELEASASSHIALTSAGEAEEREFWNLPMHRPEIKPLEIQVMPDHVHMLIYVTRTLASPLGITIAGFKAGSSKAATGACGLWAEGFQDTILFREGQLEAMRSYIRDNPRRLAVKKLQIDIFRLRRDFEIEFAELGLRGRFETIGNHFLVSSPNILQVQCSRRDFAYRRIPKPGGGRKIARDAAQVPLQEMTTAAFEEKCEEMIAAAKHGAVLVSPCISDGEREIARRAFSGGARVIKLANMGFSPLYKPGGRLFNHTADGRLLMLSPAAWPYMTAEKHMTRIDACVLNRIAQLIAGEGAAQIDYKGMAPSDIDRLVREAIAP